MSGVNFAALTICSVAYIFVGGLWYGVLFSRPWMRAVRPDGEFLDRAERRLPRILVLLLAGGLVMAIVLSILVNALNADTYSEGALCGFVIWLGFGLPLSINDLFFEKKSMPYFFMSNGYHLVSLILMGSVLAVFG